MATITWTLESPVKEKSLKDKLYTRIQYLIDDEVAEYTSDLKLRDDLMKNKKTKALSDEFKNLILQWA